MPDMVVSKPDHHNNKYNVQAIRKELDGYIRSFAWKKLRARLQGLSPELRRAVVEARHGNTGHAKKNRNTPTLLHALCDCAHATPPVPIDLLELVLDACPHLLSGPSTTKSPLAIGLDRQVSPQFLECLLMHDTSRRSLYQQDKKTGDTPLLQAVKQHANDEVILLLVAYDTNKESLLIPSKKRSRVPLFYVANHELSFVNLGPEDIPGELEYMLLQTYEALRIQRGELSPRASIGMTRNLGDDIFEDLDYVSHGDLLDEEYFGGDGHDEADDWVLGDEGTGGQSEEQYSIRLLHAVLACSHLLGDKHAVNLVGFLLSRITDLSIATDEQSNTVLHNLCQATHVFAQSTLLEGRLLTETILQRHIDSAELPNLQGNLPLHLALTTAKPWADVIVPLIRAFPETVSATNTVNGRLPLHLAILHYPSRSNVIHNIWKAYPEATTVPDPLTRLFPFHLAALAGNQRAPSSDLDQVSDIYFLLRAAPQVLRVSGRMWGTMD